VQRRIEKNILGGLLNTLQAVSVVVVNHNAGALLTDCVRSALAQAKQVIVVDNDSSDSSRDLLERYFGAEARLGILYAGRNLGFAAGCNLGLNLATQPYMLFLNPDCVMGAHSLQRLVAVIQSDTQIGMVGGLLMNPDGTEQGGARRAVPTPWRSFVRAFGLHHLSGRWPRIFLDFHLHKQPLPEKPI
jgi:GT2 family glycosyltransferase